MTDRMFLVSSPGWGSAEAGTEVTVDGAEGRHAVAVVRIRVGETVLLGGGGRRAEATVTHTGQAFFTARVGRVEDEPEPQPRFVLVQALAKDRRDEQAVETATELGVDEVVPWAAARSVVRWRDAERRERGRARWAAVALAATKQSRRSRVPAVMSPLGLDAMAGRVAGAALALVLHEEARTPIAEVAIPDTGDVLLVVGPEGGIAPEELADLVAAGAQPVRLGPEVLRTSTAGPAALAVLSARTRWLSGP